MAGIAFAGGDWLAQNWFDGNTYASEMTNVVITGDGTYTVSAKAMAASVDEETGELLGTDALDSVSEQFDNKAENVALYVKNLSALAASIKEEADALTERYKAVSKKIDALKAYLTNCMETVGKTELETGKVRIGFRRSSQIDVFSLDALPEKYRRVKHTWSPDKTLIGMALKDGESVPGVRVIEKNIIQIK